MQIFVTGGLGFVGRALCHRLLAAGHAVTASGRNPRPRMIDHPNFRYLAADLTQEGTWQEAARKAQGVVNLAGVSIFSYWTESHKQKMYDSRILTTRNLVDALKGAETRVLVSTSAVGYYGDCGEQVLTESHPAGDDFLARLAVDWEKEARAAESRTLRVMITRFGIVLDDGGGALGTMIPAFRLFLGGRLGNGRQWFPWIHRHDLARAIAHSLTQDGLQGEFNCCAPEPVRNAELTQTLAEVLGRPAFLSLPAWAVSTVMGEFGQALLNSQRALPRALEKLGFDFRFSLLRQALEEILARRGAQH
jgi:uncharacterized protein (TIGR01777 family)